MYNPGLRFLSRATFLASSCGILTFTARLGLSNWWKPNEQDMKKESTCCRTVSQLGIECCGRKNWISQKMTIETAMTLAGRGRSLKTWCSEEYCRTRPEKQTENARLLGVKSRRSSKEIIWWGVSRAIVTPTGHTWCQTCASLLSSYVWVGPTDCLLSHGGVEDRCVSSPRSCASSREQQTRSWPTFSHESWIPFGQLALADFPSSNI